MIEEALTYMCFFFFFLFFLRENPPSAKGECHSKAYLFMRTPGCAKQIRTHVYTCVCSIHLSACLSSSLGASIVRRITWRHLQRHLATLATSAFSFGFVSNVGKPRMLGFLFGLRSKSNTNQRGVPKPKGNDLV